MGLTLVTPPSVWPVTLEEAKAQCRVLHTDEDSYIQGLIRSATTYVESTLSLTIAVRTWKLTLDSFSSAIELPRGPVSSVDAVDYFDADGIAQTVDPSFYTSDLSSSRQWIVLNSGQSWPATLDGVNAVSVTYIAGFDAVPDDLKHAILLLIGGWYEARSALAEKPLQEVPLAVDALLQSYRSVMV